MKTKTESFAPFFEQSERDESFTEQMKVLEFSELVAERLDAAKMTNSDLADKMKVSRAYITKLMNGRNNFTIRSMVRVATALGTELYIGLRDVSCMQETLTLGKIDVPHFFVPISVQKDDEDTARLEAADHANLALAA